MGVTSANVGGLVSTKKDELVTCGAAFPAASDTLAVMVYEVPSIKPCKPAAEIVTIVLLFVTVFV